VTDQHCQVGIIEISNPKPPKRMRFVDVVTRLGGGVGNRVQACWCAEHTPQAGLMRKFGVRVLTHGKPMRPFSVTTPKATYTARPARFSSSRERPHLSR